MLARLYNFKEAVTRLYISLETYGESCGNPSTSQALTDDEESKSATAIGVKQVEVYAIDTAFEIIENLKIASEERYQLAKTSFQEAKRLATEAF